MEMRTAALTLAALLTVSVAGCDGDAEPSGNVQDIAQDEFRFLAEGEFIDSRPIEGSSGALVVISGGLHGVVSRADAIVVAEITEVVDVTVPTRPAPPNFPVAEIEEPPLTTYSARVDQWVKGSGPAELLVTQFGGMTKSGPQFVDGFFLLQPGRTYILSLYPKDLPTQADYVASVNGLGAFEVTDGFVHVLNHPMTQELQERFGGMPRAQFVDVLRDYAARPLPPPTLVPPPSPQPAEVGLNVIESGIPMAGIIDTVAVDTGVKANTATSLGGRKACSALARGGTLTIDVTADAVAPPREGKGGIAAFSFVLVYDPDVVKVVASDHAMLLAANSGSYLVSLSDETPDTDGRFLVAVADLGSATVPEHGSGVLARITLEGVGPGVSDLTLDSVIIGGLIAEPHAIENVLAAQVAVDAPCSP